MDLHQPERKQADLQLDLHLQHNRPALRVPCLAHLRFRKKGVQPVIIFWREQTTPRLKTSRRRTQMYFAYAGNANLLLADPLRIQHNLAKGFRLIGAATDQAQGPTLCTPASVYAADRATLYQFADNAQAQFDSSGQGQGQDEREQKAPRQEPWWKPVYRDLIVYRSSAGQKKLHNRELLFQLIGSSGNSSVKPVEEQLLAYVQANTLANWSAQAKEKVTFEMLPAEVRGQLSSIQQRAATS